MVIAGVLGGVIPSIALMVYLVATAPLPRHYLASPGFVNDLLRSPGLGIPFSVLAGMAALATYTPATHRSLIHMLGRQTVMMGFGLTILMLLSTFIPRQAFQGRVLEISMAGCLVPMIFCGIFSTLRQIRRDRRPLKR